MIFDLLTSLIGHQFDPRVKFYLHSVLLIIPVNLICKLIMFEKKNPLRIPTAPKSHPCGMTQASEQKSCLLCFVSFICKNTHNI